MFSKKPALIVCFVFILSSSLHAQPFPPAPWPIPPDTSHYLVTNWVGQQVSVRRPPDSMMNPATLVIRFRSGALDSGILSETYWSFFYGHGTKGKGGIRTLGGTGGIYDDSDEPRGFYPALRSLLFSDRFAFDSSDNIVKDSLLKYFLIANGGLYLHRFTAASPLDTLTITTQGDTVPCDLPNWMVLSFDSTVNPLLLAYLLLWEFPNDISMAYPSYQGVQLYGQPSDLFYTLGYQRGIRMIEADTAWNHEVGDSSIIVEVADAGLDYRHPDFGDSVVGNGHKWMAVWDFGQPPNGNDSVYALTPDHGTAMSGIIGALSNNVIGRFSPFDSSVAGIAGGHGSLPLHAASMGRGVTLAGYVVSSGNGTNVWDASIFEASSRSPNTPFGLGVHVINCSEGFPAGNGGAQPEDVHAALNYAYLNGVVFVAAVGETMDTSAGVDNIRNYPSDYEDPWVIAVGGSTNVTDREKIQQSNYGYTLDLIAPAGGADPLTGDNSYVLNYTTRKLTPTSPFTYGPYGGTSSGAANVSGSAALLLSHYIRTDSGLKNIEPEDIQNILKASAWRGDTERLAHPNLAESWVPHNGWGHLDIGHAFQMLDSNTTASPDAGYKLYHGTAVAVPVLDTGAWGAFHSVEFSPPWQQDAEGDTFAIGMISYLPWDADKDYTARSRQLTFTVTLPDSLENSDTCPLFVWGRNGGAGQPSGWTFSTTPNYETGWTMVTNGLGGDSLMEGIFAPSDKEITLETAQWDVYGWNDSTGNYTNYLGHFPRDPEVAVNFSYFGRAKKLSSGVREGPSLGNDSMYVTIGSNGIVTANFYTNTGIQGAKIELIDVLGRVMSESTIDYAKTGWNSAQLSSINLPSGAYFCAISGDDYLQVKNFVLIK